MIAIVFQLRLLSPVARATWLSTQIELTRLGHSIYINFLCKALFQLSLTDLFAIGVVAVLRSLRVVYLTL